MEVGAGASNALWAVSWVRSISYASCGLICVLLLSGSVTPLLPLPHLLSTLFLFYLLLQPSGQFPMSL